MRGTAHAGALGPDLTHVGSRQSLAAGRFPNRRGYLAGWIADAQALKPGVRMPSYQGLDGESLRALTAYVEGLE